MAFTDFELEYLRSQRLGRLATLTPGGTLQNSPVGFQVDEGAGVIEIWGRDMGNTRKFHNVAANGEVAFVVDDLASVTCRTQPGKDPIPAGNKRSRGRLSARNNPPGGCRA